MERSPWERPTTLSRLQSRPDRGDPIRYVRWLRYSGLGYDEQPVSREKHVPSLSLGDGGGAGPARGDLGEGSAPEDSEDSHR